nr:F-box domain-containing protein [Tanacetum cinerariifolium]
AKIPEVMVQVKVFDPKGIDHTRYTISFTNVVNVPKQGGVFGDCGIWTCIFLYRLSHGISLDVDNPIQTALAYREHLAKKLSIVNGHSVTFYRMIVSVPTPYPASHHQMEPYDQAYKFTYEKRDVVLRTSYRPYNYGKKYYVCPCSEPGTQDRGCGYFMWMGHFRTRISSSSGPSTPPRLYTRPSTRPSYSTRTSGSALNLGQAECSNCKFLPRKIKTLEAKIKILEGTLEMERHPKNHTLEQLHYFTSCIMT